MLTPWCQWDGWVECGKTRASTRNSLDRHAIFSLHLNDQVSTKNFTGDEQTATTTQLHTVQCLSQDLETGCLKLAVVKFLGVQIFKGDHNILIFQPRICINSSE